MNAWRPGNFVAYDEAEKITTAEEFIHARIAQLNADEAIKTIMSIEGKESAYRNSNCGHIGRGSDCFGRVNRNFK